MSILTDEIRQSLMKPNAPVRVEAAVENTITEFNEKAKADEDFDVGHVIEAFTRNLQQQGMHITTAEIATLGLEAFIKKHRGAK